MAENHMQRRIGNEIAKMQNKPERFLVRKGENEKTWNVSLHEGEQLLMDCCFYLRPKYPFEAPDIYLNFLHFPVPSQVCINSKNNMLCSCQFTDPWHPTLTIQKLMENLYKWVQLLQTNTECKKDSFMDTHSHE